MQKQNYEPSVLAVFCVTVISVTLGLAVDARAEDAMTHQGHEAMSHDMTGMDMMTHKSHLSMRHGKAKPKNGVALQGRAAMQHGEHAMPMNHDGMGSMPMQHGGDHAMSMPMNGFFGQYPMSREASGTSWQPQSTPMHGIHGMSGDWTTMVHGNVALVYDNQGGPRGDEKTFAEGMLMGMASRPWEGGTLGFRAMVPSAISYSPVISIH